ncbi:MAG TPA: hypothetical protein VG389_20245 [Myxococcota bacterium]|jgi:hypothetical protein|nr:hypothetical protein [Myxococcota bacterium]
MNAVMDAPTAAGVARLVAPPWRLLLQALGPPRSAAGKLGRLARGVWSYLDGRRIDERLSRLKAHGLVERVPTRVQLWLGSADMLRFWIVPAARDYYRARGIDFRFHQLLRFLEEPLSLTDPVGLLSERDAIIGHLMQVVHANPAYDLQLLEMFADGLDALEQQLDDLLAGVHPRAASIAAVVEDAGYHARLRAHVRLYRRDPAAAAAEPLLRDNVAADPRWRAVERVFGTLPGAMRYFAALPAGVAGALVHLATVRTFHPPHAHPNPRSEE